MTPEARRVWRDGIVPQLTTHDLEVLRNALANDDKRICQGMICHPVPIPMFPERQPEAACLIGFCGWQGRALESGYEVEGFFERVCDMANKRLGDPVACRDLIQWFDDTPRPIMLSAMLAEVELALEQRKAVAS